MFDNKILSLEIDVIIISVSGFKNLFKTFEKILFNRDDDKVINCLLIMSYLQPAMRIYIRPRIDSSIEQC